MQLSHNIYANTKSKKSSIVIRKIFIVLIWCILRVLVIWQVYTLSVETSKLFHFLFKVACISLVWCYKAKITMFTQKVKKIKNRLTNDSIASNRVFFKYTLFWKVLHVYLLGQRIYLIFCIKQLVWKIMQLSQIMYANTKPQEKFNSHQKNRFCVSYGVF